MPGKSPARRSQNYRSWSKAIDAWQRPIANDTAKPAWYRGMLFNELYYLLDGGTFWDNGEVGRPGVAERNHFSYMECYEYPLYSSLDVRFYSSWALLKLWPELEKSEIRDFADTVPLNYGQNHWNNWDREVMPRKVSGAVALDLGHPHEDPIRRVNWFNSVSPVLFKDINSQFVLQVYRDAFLSGAEDMTFLRYCWPAVKASIDYYKKFDTRGTGLPEHPGMPDQTYDTWPMRGTSAYTGSLWLAALKAASRMAVKLGDVEASRSYDAMFGKAQTSFIKQLWNGQYFNFDTGSPYRSASMADQLAGQWWANLCGPGGSRSAGDDSEVARIDIQTQRDGIPQRRNGRGKRHEPRWLHPHAQPGIAGGLDRHDPSPGIVFQVGRNARRGLQDCTRHIQRGLCGQGLLVSYP